MRGNLVQTSLPFVRSSCVSASGKSSVTATCKDGRRLQRENQSVTRGQTCVIWVQFHGSFQQGVQATYASDPAVYDLEMEQIFARTWLLLGFESQVADPGDFVTSDMAEDAVVMSRQLVSVPREQEAYYNELDKEQWGLVRVPRVESYKGMVFGCWDPDVRSLEDYLGDVRYYLDSFIDYEEGGMEVC